jgi:putative hydrolase of the HAD superfamily
MGGDLVSAPALSAAGIKALVFDLDGTLYQDDRLGEEVSSSANRYIAELKGISVSRAEAMLQQARDCGDGMGGTLSRAVLALGGNLQQMHQRLSRDVHPEGVLTEDPRVPELLKKLAPRFDLHIYTNNNQELSGRIMTQIGVAGLFQKVFTIEDFGRPKPDKTALFNILESIGRKPAETLFIGDRYQVDLQLPESLGCPIFEAKQVEVLLRLAQLVD